MGLRMTEEPKTWRCERCGFASPWWVGGEHFKFCASCQRAEDRTEAARRRAQAQAAAELAELERMEEEMPNGTE